MKATILLLMHNSKFVIVAGFGLALLLMLAITVVGLTRMHFIKQSMESITADQNIKIELITNLRTVARERILLMHKMLLMKDAFDLDDAQQTFNRLAGEFMRTRTLLQQQKMSPVEAATLENTLRNVIAASAFQEDMIRKLMQGDYLNAQDALIKKAAPAQENVFSWFNELINLQQQATRLNLASARQDYQHAVWTMSLLAVLNVVLTVGIIVLVVRRTARTERTLRKEITERIQAEAESLRFKNVLDNTLDMILMFEPDTLRFVYVNQGAILSMGYSREELLGMTSYQIKPLVPEPKFRQLIAPLLSGEQSSLRFETLHLRKDDTVFPVDILLQLVTQSDGSSLFVSIVHDITERKRAQNEILRLNASLEERVKQRTEELEEKVEQLALTSKYKSEFLSNMSHELRTPLNSVLVLSELLASNDESNMSEEQVKFLKVIHGSGKDLLELINDILDMAKIESGKVTSILEDVSFTDVSAHIEWNFRHLMESRGLGFSITLAPELPSSLYTDHQRLLQVMKNLLSNALKFTEQGQISVRIAPVELGLHVDHDGQSRAETVIGFYVTDTGIGLADDKRKIIFEAFQQADTGTTRKYGGTGLGLSISREIAWLLGGELRLLESEPGKGSTFVLYLPLRAPEPGQGITFFTPKTNQSTPAAQEIMPLPETSQEPILNSTVGSPSSADLASTPSPASLTGKKVLLVDDDPHNIIALTALLLRHKMVVTSAENGRAALEQLGNNSDVDIVLMDIMMPEMDGYEAMRQIRQMKQFESLPMVALTAKAMNGDREKCIAAGASDYVSKPVDADKLCSIMRALLCR